jgi:hypothetical protein
MAIVVGSGAVDHTLIRVQNGDWRDKFLIDGAGSQEAAPPLLSCVCTW